MFQNVQSNTAGIKKTLKTKPALWTRVRGAKPVRCRARAAKQPKPRRRLAFRSANMKHRMALYKPMRDAFLWERRVCQCCLASNCDYVSNDVHHMRGRAGDLLFYSPFWLAICRPCHIEFDKNRTAAQAAGCFCGRGFWGQMPDGIKMQEFNTGTNDGKIVSIMIPCRFDAELNDWIVTPEAHQMIDMVKRYYTAKANEG
jgi:hypothetical protein